MQWRRPQNFIARHCSVCLTAEWLAIVLKSDELLTDAALSLAYPSVGLLPLERPLRGW